MDLYILLGVQREASVADIKRAYRRLARRWHPDINPGDENAATRFSQVLAAYETLIDPDRRRRYDSGAVSSTPADASTFGFAGFDFSRAAVGDRATTFGDLFEEVLTEKHQRAAVPQRGADLHFKVSVSFDEAWGGVERQFSITRQDSCRVCGGSGIRHTEESRCFACDETGSVRSVRGHMVFAKTCARCQGSGRLRQQSCDACRGVGLETRSDTLTVQIPAGVRSGARLRIGGKGHAGASGGEAGDLYIDVDVRPDPRFERRGDHLHCVIPVAIHEAALGARLDIALPDGPARFRVLPGTQSGQRFRVRGRGMVSTLTGERGDLIVEVRLMLPDVLSERSKELLREFARINGNSVRHDPVHGETHG